ncbi:HAMP domain-containing histidine kinase [Fulvivirga maritima]|uniref:sensor histidine kinase n=1 Tax=Fulvivirga maritima TaxID=2904247 RepID=UPI001F37C13D|nr:HAMP domain-containing sensor histidine kinase [Fulvivirga maritima]UII28111.1 HAMP domain-containing histidine kinase [Fulvivirga maritima]
MRRTTIRLLVILAAISIIGIVVTQVYWFKQAFNTETERFDREVNTALYHVAQSFFKLSDAEPANNPIKQLSTNYYVVMINNEIDAGLLEHLLRAEFEKRNITADFEYGIYDCTSDKMVYGSYVSMTPDRPVSSTSMLPKWENQNYYFGVQFPNKASFITDRMGIWIFSSTVLFTVVIFFAYALFVILKQKRLSEIQKDFINNMTHEFKTPISTIALSTDVLKDPNIVEQPERLRNYAMIIENENLRLKHQVERVLQMANLNKQEISLKSEVVNVHHIIEDTQKSMMLSLGEKGGEIICKLEADNAEMIGDKLHLTNVIFNLIDNAIKYCNTVPKVEIRTYNENGRLFIEVKDNGVGINKQHQSKIFDQFFRVPTGNIHDVKGFGLGLNYVKIVTRAHKGTIKVDSEPDQGSTFEISFLNVK